MSFILSFSRLRSYAEALDGVYETCFDGLEGELSYFLDAYVSAVDESERAVLRDLMTAALETRAEACIVRCQAEADDLFDALSDEQDWGAVSVAHDVDLGEKCENTIRGASAYLFSDEPDATKFFGRIREFLRREVVKAPNDAMAQNVNRYKELGLRWARVPCGYETCAFCAMLAGRGFVYHSAKFAGDGHEYHAHCRCKVIPGKKGTNGVEGYDPRAWQRLAERFKEIDKAEVAPSHKADGTAMTLGETREMLKREEMTAYLRQRADELRPRPGKRVVRSQALKASGGGEARYLKPEQSFAVNDETKDIVVHEALERYGFAFDILPEDAPGEGHSNIDLVIGGRLWEVKSPYQPGDERKKDKLGFVYDNLRRARSQVSKSIDGRNDGFVRVVFNGAFCAYSDDSIGERIAKEMCDLGIDQVMQLRKDGSLVLHYLDEK